MLTREAMPCQKCFRYAMDELTLPERAIFERHLGQCTSCQEEAAYYQVLRQSVESDLAADRAQYTAPPSRLLTTRRFGLGLTAAALALFAFLPEQDALADRLHVTASRVHANIVHQVGHLNSAAHHLYTRVHIRK